MPDDRVKRVVTAYFQRPAKEYAQVVELIKASGGLAPEEASKVRQSVAAVHADAILRHLDEASNK